MSITLILNGKQRRKLHLPKQRLAWVGGILFSVLALGGGWGVCPELQAVLKRATAGLAEFPRGQLRNGDKAYVQ